MFASEAHSRSTLSKHPYNRKPKPCQNRTEQKENTPHREGCFRACFYMCSNLYKRLYYVQNMPLYHACFFARKMLHKDLHRYNTRALFSVLHFIAFLCIRWLMFDSHLMRGKHTLTRAEILPSVAFLYVSPINTHSKAHRFTSNKKAPLERDALCWFVLL